MRRIAQMLMALLSLSMGVGKVMASSQGAYPAYSGNKRIAIIMLAWSDTACPATRQDVANKIWNNWDSLRKYYRDMSRNALDFVPPADAAADGTVPATTSAIYGPYELSVAAGYTEDITFANAEANFGGSWQLSGSHSVARDLAAADGFVAANYDYVMYVTPKTTNTGNTGGYAGVNMNYQHMFVLRQNYINHEVGHSLGLSHSNSAIDVDGYTSQDCVMGNAVNTHLDEVHTYNMGWYPDANFSAVSYGQYKIENLAQDTDNLKVLRFDRLSHGATTNSSYNLWVGYRVKGIGQDAALDSNWNRKVNIHYCKVASKRPSDYSSYYYLNNNVSKLSATGTYTDPDNVCKVQYLREDNSGYASAVVQLIDPDGNQPPAIPSGQSYALSFGTNVFTVNATDPENNPLTYSIVTGPSSGSLTVAGNLFIYTGSTAGTYQFTLRVNDGQYDSFDRTVQIVVAASTVPKVSVVASDSKASEEGPDSGTWIIGRIGDLSNPLTVFLSLGGSASVGDDYTHALVSPVTFAAGQSLLSYTLQPVDDHVFLEGTESAILTVAPDSNYSIGFGSATIQITDNENLLPIVNAGADKSVLLDNTGPWSPVNLSTCLWLDAKDVDSITQSAGKVSQWRDKSGNLRHVSQSTASAQPGFSSNTVIFDGSDDHLWNSAPFMYNLGSVDVYMVMAALSGTDRRFLSEASSTSSYPVYSMAQTDDVDPTIMSVYIRQDFALVRSGQPPLSASGALDGSAKLYQWRDTGNAVSGRVNGGGATSSAYTRSGTMTTNRFSIGGLLKAGIGSCANANINEIIMTSNLSDADRQKLEGYLAHKWGLGANLPGTHPFRNAAPKDGVSVQLSDARVSDPEGGSVSAIWSVISKPNGALVSFDNAYSVNAVVSMYVAGSYVLRLTTSDGTNTVYDEVTIVVNLSPSDEYSVWAGGSFADPFYLKTPEDNQDGDGFTNILEFAFGTDPTLANGGTLKADGSAHGGPMLSEAVGGVMEFYFIRRKDYGASGSLSYTVQFSSDLGFFYNSSVTPSFVADSSVDSDYEVVKVPYPVSLPNSQPARFGRVRVEFVP